MRININNTPRRYSVIYADPPWAYKQQGGAKGRGTAKAHYDTMQTAEICSLPVKEIATEDALLFMWATFPNIKDALEVMEAWGFEYKTAAFVWVKTNAKSGSLFWGMGSYTRANAEVCLLGIRKKTKAGKCVKAHNIHQIIQAPYTRHSEKPPETRERIKALTGSAGGVSRAIRPSSRARVGLLGKRSPRRGGVKMSVKNIDIKTPERTVPEKVILFAAQLPEGMTAILTDAKTGAEYRITSTSERCSDNAT